MCQTILPLCCYYCYPPVLQFLLFQVELVNEPPNTEKCEFLGEISGSQGNWITGDYTSNENLVMGARNELRNKAFQMGGNIVHVQDMRNASAYGAMGTTNTTAIGKVYRCKK